MQDKQDAESVESKLLSQQNDIEIDKALKIEDRHQYQEMDNILLTFINANNWSEAFDIYEANQEILNSPIVENILALNIAVEKDANKKSTLQVHLEVIRRAKSDGINAAFDSVVSNAQPSNEGLHKK